MIPCQDSRTRARSRPRGISVSLRPPRLTGAREFSKFASEPRPGTDTARFYWHGSNALRKLVELIRRIFDTGAIKSESS